MLSLIQFTMPGVPCIYYGDEAGVQGYTDPFNRGPYPWGREDQELLVHYRMLAALRQQYPVLAPGRVRAPGLRRPCLWLPPVGWGDSGAGAGQPGHL